MTGQVGTLESGVEAALDSQVTGQRDRRGSSGTYSGEPGGHAPKTARYQDFLVANLTVFRFDDEYCCFMAEAKEPEAGTRWEASDLVSSAEAESRWIDQRLAPFRAHTVGSIVPTRFESYCRVFHPAWTAYAPDGSGERPVRWNEVAAVSGAVTHPAMEWDSIVRGVSESSKIWADPPWMGELGVDEAVEMSNVLAGHTTTPDVCFFAFTALNNMVESFCGVSSPPTKIGKRPFHVFTGPIARIASAIGPSIALARPNLWWPRDAAWCVGSDIDLMTTYVGASRNCVEQLLSLNSIEAMPVPEDQSILFSADTIND